MTKFIRTLIIINGLLIPGILLVMFSSFLIEAFGSKNYKPDPVIKDNLITKDGDTLMTQGLAYKDPESIYNSSNLMIKISPRTFDEPKLLDIGSGSYSKFESDEYYINLLFLDSEFNLLSTLVNKKASIRNITIPQTFNSEKIDTTVKNIGYLIAFEDSNNDNQIDSEDNYDLYISDLNGKKLTQITSDLDIKTFEFINNHKEVFISFTDRQDIPEEHKITRFALYNIKTNQLRYLTHLDKAINSIQKILNN